MVAQRAHAQSVLTLPGLEVQQGSPPVSQAVEPPGGSGRNPREGGTKGPHQAHGGRTPRTRQPQVVSHMVSNAPSLEQPQE